jgi:tRNA-dihydrouridine synthase
MGSTESELASATLPGKCSATVHADWSSYKHDCCHENIFPLVHSMPHLQTIYEVSFMCKPVSIIANNKISKNKEAVDCIHRKPQI